MFPHCPCHPPQDIEIYIRRQDAPYKTDAYLACRKLLLAAKQLHHLRYMCQVTLDYSKSKRCFLWLQLARVYQLAKSLEIGLKFGRSCCLLVRFSKLALNPVINVRLFPKCNPTDFGGRQKFPFSYLGPNSALGKCSLLRNILDAREL
jgi:hypothetical protein